MTSRTTHVTTEPPVVTPPGGIDFTKSSMLPFTAEEESDDAMEYWAIIVGSVLGGLALVGVLGYVMYRSRQR